MNDGLIAMAGVLLVIFSTIAAFLIPFPVGLLMMIPSFIGGSMIGQAMS